jgi:glycosyltransferase involved in cell wall biosynthesis
MTKHQKKSGDFIEIWPGKGFPEISILMPIFEQPKYIKESVVSVLNQVDVIAEVIISDDASSDGTYDIALASVKEFLEDNDCTHRILMRKGSQRLWRDHLPLLVEKASCEIVCQAHGDDISLPNRAKFIVHIFKHMPQVSLLASEAFLIDQNNKFINKQRPTSNEVKLSRIHYEEIIKCEHPYLIGFSQAWRRDLLTFFPRLDRQFAATSHDRILPFRASLVGEVYIINSQLIARREHSDAARYLMFDEPETKGNFGWTLTRIAAKDAMLKDLKLAYSMGKLSEEVVQQLQTLMAELMERDISILSEAYRKQTFSGRQIAWVDQSTLKDIRKKRSISYSKSVA